MTVDDQAPAEERAHRDGRRCHHQEQPGRRVLAAGQARAARRARAPASRWAHRGAPSAGCGRALRSLHPPAGRSLVLSTSREERSSGRTARPLPPPCRLRARARLRGLTRRAPIGQPRIFHDDAWRRQGRVSGLRSACRIDGREGARARTPTDVRSDCPGRSSGAVRCRW